MIELTLRVANSIGDVAAEAWDACANPSWPDRGNGAGSPCPPPADAQTSVLGDRYNPFISHDFLSALERSQSVRARAGWQPMHLLAEDAQGSLFGAVPCYVKSHSRGEYVFDHGWAEAYERAGGSYYPKLQVSVPFTPATGRRLLARAGPQADAVRAHLADALTDICRRCGASSVHVTFPTEPEWALLAARGYLKRTHQQFHWENAGYASFDAFLAALASRKRKTIRRERADALAAGVSVHWLTGTDLTESVWDAFFAFYMETGSRKWGRPYLTREFYSLVGEKMRERMLDRRRHQLHRLRHAVRPPLGRNRAPPVPALRALLLSGHPIRHRAQARARRGRRPGRAQDFARLCADDDLFRALHRRSGAAARDRGFPQARARLCGGGGRGACGRRAVPQGVSCIPDTELT
jgi:uncharacterized protein